MSEEKFRVLAQIAEILGDDNRWFCCEYYRKFITHPDVLADYFVKSGGAANFAWRFTQAMSDDNRYYAYLFYGREILDPVILWRYFMEHRQTDFDWGLAC